MQQQEFRRLAAELKNNLARLMDKRSTWESHWQECADFMQPRKAEINKERQRGDKRNIQIFDATAIHASELLAASLHGMLTSSANRWFSLRSSSLSNSTILNTIDSYTENLKSNKITNQNFYIWPVLGQYIWPNFFVGSTHEEEIEFLKSWIDDRLDWMDNEINSLN
mgnify:CR=1 FL=1